MAVQDELEAILARLQRMREELRIDVTAIEADGARDGITTSGPEVVIVPPSPERHGEV
jgi:hypothetical protein